MIIEDDPRIREAVARTLDDQGHAVRSASTGMAGLQQIDRRPPDVVVLDLGLPDIDGRELLRMLRAVSAVPVIVATARDDEARHRRRPSTPAPTTTSSSRTRPTSSTPASGPCSGAGSTAQPSPADRGRWPARSTRPATSPPSTATPLDLTRKEFELLAYLAANAGHVVTKRQLLADIWQQPYGGADKTVDVHLSWLRRKLGESAAEPRYIRTIRGVGVKLVDPDGLGPRAPPPGPGRRGHHHHHRPGLRHPAGPASSARSPTTGPSRPPSGRPQAIAPAHRHRDRGPERRHRSWMV